VKALAGIEACSGASFAGCAKCAPRWR
jgi:hypothetical protein